MSSGRPRQNPYLSAPVGQLFAKTALPIIFLMSMSGLLNVVDAIFLGMFVGPDAVSTVTVIFPVAMLLITSSTLVTSGIGVVLTIVWRLASSPQRGPRPLLSGREIA